MLRLVVDRHRVAERERRQALGLARRQIAERERRILDEARNVAHLELADLERVDPRELQAAKPDVADAGAERLRDRQHAEALRGRPRDDRVLRSGVDDEILFAGAVHPRAHDHLVVHQLERDREQPARRVPGSTSNGTRCAERAQEPDLVARPAGLVAGVLVRQQVDVVGVGDGRLLELVRSARRSRRRCDESRGRAGRVAARPAPGPSPARAGRARRASAPCRGGRAPAPACRASASWYFASACSNRPDAHSASPYSASDSGARGLSLISFSASSRALSNSATRSADWMTPPRACRIWSGGADLDRVAIGFERFLVASLRRTASRRAGAGFRPTGTGASRRLARRVKRRRRRPMPRRRSEIRSFPLQRPATGIRGRPFKNRAARPGV